MIQLNKWLIKLGLLCTLLVFPITTQAAEAVDYKTTNDVGFYGEYPSGTQENNPPISGNGSTGTSVLPQTGITQVGYSSIWLVIICIILGFGLISKKKSVILEEKKL